VNAPLQLVVGLGNPGPRYERTRHNAGFWFVDALARAGGVGLRATARFHGDTGEVELERRRIRLLKPQTFMNRSGLAVAAMARFYRFPSEALLVAHDDIDLPPGTARLKRGGGNAGHNGLASIAAELGSGEFVRLRIGVGHPGHKDDVHDYVLRAAPREEEALIEESLERALEVFPVVAAGELARAMNVLHRRRPRGDDEAPGKAG